MHALAYVALFKFFEDMPQRSILAASILLLVHASSFAADRIESIGAKRLSKLPELSGLAASHRHAGHWWGLNDSGNPAELVLLGPGREQVGSVQIQGAVNHDWEDLASFERDGRSWLLIGDIGNNFGFRAEGQLLIVEEPANGQAEVSIEREIRFRFEDGARDCEAVAVDVATGQILLADKGHRPASLYALPLAHSEGVAVARRIAHFPELVPTPEPKVLGLGALRGRGTPTAMDLSVDGQTLGVLTYLSLSLFHRAPGQSWAEALARPERSMRLPRKTGFEAMAFGAGGDVLIGSEGLQAHFARWRPLSPQVEDPGPAAKDNP